MRGTTTDLDLYVDGSSLGCSEYSLDAALVTAIAYRNEREPNSQAAYYFLRMIGAKEPTP